MARAASWFIKRSDVLHQAPTAIAAPGATLALDAKVSQRIRLRGGTCRGDRRALQRRPRGRRCSSSFFGYTALNDVTARGLCSANTSNGLKGRAWTTVARSGRGSSPRRDRRPQSLGIRLRLNGVQKAVRQHIANDLLASRLVVELSRGMTLLPGDVIATGTPEGVGFARTPPEFLKTATRSRSSGALGALRKGGGGVR